MATRLTEVVKEALRIAASRGMSQAEGDDIIEHVMLLAKASTATTEDVPEDAELGDLVTDGIFTEVSPTLHLDLAVIGSLVRRGYLRASA